MHQDQWIIQATLESFEAESNERIKQREWVNWVAAGCWVEIETKVAEDFMSTYHWLKPV